MTTEQSQSPRDERSRFWRAVSVAAFVTVAAPPIGALAYVALAVARLDGGEFSGAAAAPIGDLASSIVGIGYVIVIFSYILGGPAAAIAGLALGCHVYIGGNVSLRRALVTAAIATFVAAAIAGVSLGDSPLSFVLILTPSALLSAIVCRSLMRKLGLVG